MMRIYLTNLADYNNGYLNGEWVELPVDDDFEEALTNIGCMNEDGEIVKEWFITDYESDIPDFKIDEYESIEELNELAEEYEGLDDYEKKKVYSFFLFEAEDLRRALDEIDGHILITGFDNLEDYAEQEADESGILDKIPDYYRNHIDWEGIARDLEFSGYKVSEYGVWY